MISHSAETISPSEEVIFPRAEIISPSEEMIFPREEIVSDRVQIIKPREKSLRLPNNSASGFDCEINDPGEATKKAAAAVEQSHSK